MEELLRKLLKPILKEVYEEGYQDGERRILKAFEYGLDIGYKDGLAYVGAINLEKPSEDEIKRLSEEGC